jgi:GNAT superfamily N-acetyltransferase
LESVGRASGIPSLRGGRLPPGRPDSLDGGTRRACRVVYFVRALVPPRERGVASPRYGGLVRGEVRIEPITAEQLGGLLPMIAAYQRFYEAPKIDEERNRDFFRRFLAPSDDGLLLGAWDDGQLVGYACLYWTFSSLVPAEIVLMNDLFVVEAARGRGVGRALIKASAAAARERGAHHLEWVTATDNLTAQRLYDSTEAERSTWIAYELDP